jgi:alpha-beta hydrolase superfamily lysophospholipase
MGIDAVKVRKAMRPLCVIRGRVYPEPVLRYFEYYGLDFADEGGERCEHLFGTFESNGNTLAAHIFRPGEYKATVFVLHGYLEHCGQLNHLISYLLKGGYAVATYDMPGHGLSSGERGAIEDFSEYSLVLHDFVEAAKVQLRGPYHLIGHSIGGAIALDYLFRNKQLVFENVVLVAPLVRSVLWGPSKIGHHLYSLFGTSVPRKFSNSSSDKAFLDFVETKDPLQVQMVPLKWVKALYEWNTKVATCGGYGKAVKIIQGTSDTTVAWKFNIKFIQKNFGEVQVTLIENGRHSLLNESSDIRRQVFLQVSSYLEDR